MSCIGQPVLIAFIYFVSWSLQQQCLKKFLLDVQHWTLVLVLPLLKALYLLSIPNLSSCYMLIIKHTVIIETVVNLLSFVNH